jgi:hypothetical protein
VSSCAILSGAPAAPSNPNETYERIGINADGSFTTITAAGTAHVKGSYATIGTTVSAYAGFYLEIGQGSSSTARYLIDIRINSTTVILPDFYSQGGASSNGRIFVPISVAAGTLIEARCQCATASATIGLAISGRVRTASHPALYSQGYQITTADTTSTHPSTTSVTLQSTLTTWTQLVASTAADYGALLLTVGYPGTNFATTQQGSAFFAADGAGSEAKIGGVV